MIHLYTDRKYSANELALIGTEHYRRDANTFKLLCTREWIVENDMIRKGPYRRMRPKSVTTVRSAVTCPRCLDLLIPQVEDELNKMKAAYSIDVTIEVKP